MVGSEGRLIKVHIMHEKRKHHQHTIPNGGNGTDTMMKKETVTTLLPHGGATIKKLGGGGWVRGVAARGLPL